jgi:hypothetical protein
MAKKRKTKAKPKRKVAKSKKRAAPARKRKPAARKPARKSAKPKRRAAKTKLPSRSSAPTMPRPMTQPGPAVTPIAARPSPFPSSVPGDFPTKSPDGKN